MNNLRIVFMGTPDFAVESLKILVENNYNIVGVITSADKPAGRGQKIHQSAVKEYALEKGLNILQPKNLKAPEFVEELRSLNADLQIIVAFRMLPEIVWNMPKLGTFNLHGSLLPRYRGAAPINWAVINGDKETGVTTFFLKHEIDTGNIIFREKLQIKKNDTAGIIHDKLMEIGANLVLKTVKAIETEDYPQIHQNEFVAEGEELKHAPKIFKEDCKIDWTKNAENIHNLIRGLSPYPAAWTEFKHADNEKKTSMKIYQSEIIKEKHEYSVGTIVSDNKFFLHIAAQNKNGENCFISIKQLQQAGKRRLEIKDFLRGVKLEHFDKTIIL